MKLVFQAVDSEEVCQVGGFRLPPDVNADTIKALIQAKDKVVFSYTMSGNFKNIDKIFLADMPQAQEQVSQAPEGQGEMYGEHYEGG